MPIIENIKGLLRGKSLDRINFNLLFSKSTPFQGAILDVGGTLTASYRRLAPVVKGQHTISTLNIDPSSQAEILSDATHLPFPDQHFDHVWCFNVLEHLPDPGASLREIQRTLKPSGRAAFVIPFLMRVHPDPDDFQRLTASGIRHLLAREGFTVTRLEAIGYGPFLAGFTQYQGLLPALLNIPLYLVSHALDAIVLRLRPQLKDAWVLAYYFEATAR